MSLFVEEQVELATIMVSLPRRLVVDFRARYALLDFHK